MLLYSWKVTACPCSSRASGICFLPNVYSLPSPSALLFSLRAFALRSSRRAIWFSPRAFALRSSWRALLSCGNCSEELVTLSSEEFARALFVFLGAFSLGRRSRRDLWSSGGKNNQKVILLARRFISPSTLISQVLYPRGSCLSRSYNIADLASTDLRTWQVLPQQALYRYKSSVSRLCYYGFSIYLRWQAILSGIT